MSIELLIAIIGFFTALVGVARWLLEVRYKHNQSLEKQRTRDAEKIETLKAENYSLFVQKVEAKLKLIESAIERHTETMRHLKEEMIAATNSMEAAAERYEENRKQGEKVLVVLKENIEFVDSRLRKHDSDIIQLGKDLFMVKGMADARKKS